MPALTTPGSYCNMLAAATTHTHKPHHRVVFRMAVEATPEQLRVTDLTIEDPSVVDYFAALDDDEVQQRLHEVIRVGVTAIQAGDTAANTELVRRRFEALEHRLEDELDEVFGERGSLPEMLENHLGENGRLTDLFDPHADGTPIAKLRKDIVGEVQDFRNVMMKKEGAEELKEVTPLSGFAFEDELWEQLQALARIHGDDVERTGETTGVGHSKKGDFVVEVDGNGPRFVIEAKDTLLTLPKIKRELEESIPNRDAIFGVLLAKQQDHLPKKVGWFNEYEGNQLVAAVTDGEDDRLFDPLVRFVYSYARTRALAETSTAAADIDVPAVRAEIKGLDDDLGAVTQIKKRCTEIERLSDKIKQEADDLREGISERSRAIGKMLQSPES
jgi:hypothetical protein